VVDLEIMVWGVNPREAVPASLMHALATNGALVAGAYDAERMVGMALAVPVRHGHGWRLWSHMAAVLPECQGLGIGFGLKQFQRAWALKHGYDKIAWTYDPLLRGNANFNLHRLGAVSSTYHVNFYGVMTDAINATGLPSDRLEAEWNLRDTRVAALAEGKQDDSADRVISEDESLLLLAQDFRPLFTRLSLDAAVPACYVEIPYNLSELRQNGADLTYQWRVALREVLSLAFRAGWYAADFVTRHNRCWYVLRRPQSWFLYVLECSDQSLYTGITTDLQRRVDVHNSGRGAAYTAVRRPVKLVAAWRSTDRSSALKAEAAFKRQSRRRKLHLITSHEPYKEMPIVELD
jgi:predicted GNAT superfamily acetyltransferase